jgi:hypothetical protein
MIARYHYGLDPEPRLDGNRRTMRVGRLTHLS